MTDAAYNKFASRKFLMAMVVIVIGTVLSTVGMLTPLLVDLFKWTCGLYFGFNVSQKTAEWIAQRFSGEAQ